MADAYSYLVALFLIATVIVNFNINVVVLVMMRKRRLYVIVANRLFLQFVLIDFIACFFVFIPASVTAILESWAFSDPACHIHGVVTTLVYIVIFGLLIVRCVERITKIKNRELHKAVFCSNCRLMLVSLVVWLVGLVVSVIPLSGWVSFKYDYYHSGCIVQLEESALYLFLVFPLGVGLTAVFVIIAFVIVLKADKNVGDIERINGGRGWYMGNGSKPDENKNPNMATASANLIITTVSVIFFFPYFMIMFIRSAGADMWRGAYSICLVPIVLTFTLRPFIYLFRLRMSIKAKEKNTPHIPGDKKRILAVSRKGKRHTLPNDEKRGDPGEPNYSSDEWSEYDEEKSKTCCFFPKSKRYDEKHAPPPPYESVPEKSHPKPFPLKQKKDAKSDKQPGDPVFKKPNLHNTKPNNDDIDDDEMSEFYLDGNSSENEMGKNPKNRSIFDKKYNSSLKPKPKDQDDPNESKDGKNKRKLQKGKDSNSELEKLGNDPESFLSPRMIKIQENPKRKSKRPNDKTEDETLSSENSDNDSKSKRKRRHRRKPKGRLSNDDSDSYDSYSEEDRPVKKREKTKIIVIKQRVKSSDTKRNSPKSKKSNKIEPKENKEPSVEETLRKQNNLNPFIRPGGDKTDKNGKNKDEKSRPLDSDYSVNSYDSENSSENDGRKKARYRNRPGKNDKRRGYRKGQDQTDDEDTNRKKQKKKGKYDSNSDTDDYTDDDRKRRKKRKRNKLNSDDQNSQTNEENGKKAIDKSKRNPLKNRDYKDENLSDDSIDPTRKNLPKTVIPYGLENDTNPGINKNTMEEMLKKNIDSQIVPIVQNNYYYIDPTRMGNQTNPIQSNTSESMTGNSQNEKGHRVPPKAEWKKSDANNHPSIENPTETQKSFPRTYNNAPVNLDNLPESKSLDPSTDKGILKDVYENLGTGDPLEPYKRRRLVPNGSKDNDTILEDGSSDRKLNLTETMGQGDPMIPYHPDDQFESRDANSSNINSRPENENYKETDKHLQVMGPGQTMEPYNDGNYNPRSQRSLLKNMKSLNENNIPPGNQINDQDSPTTQDSNKNKDLTNILGPGDPIIPHENSEDDVTDSENKLEYPANGLNHSSNHNPKYVVNNPPYNHVGPQEFDPLGRSKIHPNFSNPNDGNYASHTGPNQYNPHFDPNYVENNTYGPKGHHNYPYVPNGTDSIHNPEDFANYRDTQNQYNPRNIRPQMNRVDYPIDSQNLPNERSYPNYRSYPNITTGNLKGGLDNVNIPFNPKEPFHEEYLNDPKYFDPYALNENEKRPYQLNKAPPMQISPEFNPGDDRPYLQPTGYSNMPVERENKLLPNSNNKNKSNEVNSNIPLGNHHMKPESNNSVTNPKFPLNNEGPTNKREKAAYLTSNDIGKPTKPYFPRSNMNSMDKFSNDPYKQPSMENNPAQFQYITPENANDHPNKNVSIPYQSTTGLQGDSQPKEREKYGPPSDEDKNLPSSNHVNPTLKSRSNQIGHPDNPHILNNSQIPNETDQNDLNISFPKVQPNVDNNKKQNGGIGPPKSYSSINQIPKDGRTVKQKSKPMNPNVTSNQEQNGSYEPTTGINKSNSEPNENSERAKHQLPEDNQMKPNQNNHPQTRVNINDPIGLPQSYSSIRQKPKEGQAVKTGQRPSNFNKNSTGTGINSNQHPNNSNPINPNVYGEPDVDDYSNNGLDHHPPYSSDQSKVNAHGPNKRTPGKTKLGNISNPNHYNNDNISMLPEDMNDGRNNPLYKNYPSITNSNNGDYNKQQYYGNSSQNEYDNGHNPSINHPASSYSQAALPNGNGQYPNDYRNHQPNNGFSSNAPQNGSNKKGLQNQHTSYNKPNGDPALNINQNTFDPYNVDPTKRQPSHGDKIGHSINETPKDNGPMTRNVKGNSTQNDDNPSTNRHGRMPGSQSNQNPNKRVTFQQKDPALKERNSAENEMSPKSSTNHKGKAMWDTADKKMSAYYHLTRIDKWDMVHGHDNKYDKSGKAAKSNNANMKQQVKDVDLL